MQRSDGRGGKVLVSNQKPLRGFCAVTAVSAHTVVVQQARFLTRSLLFDKKIIITQGDLWYEQPNIIIIKSSGAS